MMPEELHDITVFICHAHADSSRSVKPRERWLDRLLQHLTPLERDHRLKFWSSRDIKPGMHWHEEIQDKLRGSEVAVLLVSPAFFESDYIRDHELPVLLTGAHKGAVEIIPVHVRPSIIKLVKFKYPDPETGPEGRCLTVFQAVNDLDTTLASLKLYQQDQVFIKVVERILEVVMSKRRRPVMDRRQEELSSIRREFLSVRSVPELGRVFDGVENFLSRYPNDEEGRLLRDKIVEGIKWERGRVRRVVTSPSFLGMIFIVTLIGFTATAYPSLPARLVAYITGQQTPTPTPQADVPLRIIKPSDGETVGLKQRVWGRTPYSSWNHYVVLKPPKYNCKGIVSAQAVVEGNGWDSSAQIGERNTDSGKKFEVFILAIQTPLPRGAVLCEWPPGSKISEPVTVIRK
jgi:hypothetical protein